MRRHGLTATDVTRCPQTRRAGRDATQALLDGGTSPTAVLCYNDLVAFGLMMGLEARGLTPGTDMAVIGFDNVDEAAFSHPPLTTVAVDPWRIGQEAAKLMLRRLADRTGASEQIILPPQLVIRESCGGRLPAGSDGGSAA
jgi:LacI family transcriptional regulator